MSDRSEIRRIILETLIELGIQKESSVDSLGVAFDAHFALTGELVSNIAYARSFLANKYPHLIRQPTIEELNYNTLIVGKIKPIAIYHYEDSKAYYQATDEERQAWNAYAQQEADKFNSSSALDSYDSTNTCIGYNRDGKITDWCPPLFFPEWLKQRNER